MSNYIKIAILVLGLVSLLLFCGCKSMSKNIKIEDVDLPKSVAKVNKNNTDNIFKSIDLEDDLNFRRNDRNTPLYISIVPGAEIDIYKEPGDMSDNNKKGRYRTVRTAEIRDKKIINNEEWYYLKIIYSVSSKEMKRLQSMKNIDKKLLYTPPRDGWIKKNQDIVLNPTDGPIYKLSSDEKIPVKFQGKWRFIYSRMYSHMYNRYFIDTNSIIQQNEKIYFEILSIGQGMNFLWDNKKDEFIYEFLPDYLGYQRIKYCYDTKNNYIYKASEKIYDINGELSSDREYEKEWQENQKKFDEIKKREDDKLKKEGLNGVDYPAFKVDSPADEGKYLVRSKDKKLVYELSKKEPIFSDMPNLIFSSFFEVLEGR